MHAQKMNRKRAREKRIVGDMIALYCKKNHSGKTLCADCRALLDYAHARTDKCPFMESKTFCSNCRVHCYSPQMRESIRTVMRYSGPRMLTVHPVAAIRHLIESKAEKRRLQKTDQP